MSPRGRPPSLLVKAHRHWAGPTAKQAPDATRLSRHLQAHGIRRAPFQSADVVIHIEIASKRDGAHRIEYDAKRTVVVRALGPVRGGEVERGLATPEHDDGGGDNTKNAASRSDDPLHGP